MRTLRLYAVRTLGALSSSFLTSFGVALFVAVSSFLFARALARAEGTVASAAVLWATAASVTLPCLAALATMRLVADDRLSGRLDLLLSAPIYERDYLMGRFIGAFAHLGLALLAYLVVPLFLLPLCANGPSVAALSLMELLPACVGLLLQAAFGCAVGLLASACLAHSAMAGATAIVFAVFLPRAAYQALFAWSPLVRARFPIFPFEAHLEATASGMFVFSATAFFVLFAAWALFAAVKAVAATRLAGRGRIGLKLSTALVVTLGLTFAVLAFLCAIRLDFTLEWPLKGQATGFSARTRSILADTQGETRATCFLSRGDPAWRGMARLLRGLEAAARDAAGTRLLVDFADPRWDLATAVRLTRLGVKEGSVVFERGRRRIVVPVADADESACASALLRLSLPTGRETIYWTVGHGEISFDSYDPVSGMSVLARALRRDGYDIKPLAPAETPAVPDDCGVLVVAGARTPFSAAELTQVDSYLRRGGRLLVLISASARTAGVASLLPGWGLGTRPFTVVSPRTLDGSDLVASAFGSHDVVRPLAGAAVVFHDAVPLEAVENAGGEKTVFTPLVSTDAAAWGESDIAQRPWTHDATTEPAGPLILAAAVERGAGQRKDIALKPTRIVAVGDAAFAVDGALASRANANRDFFRNALAWLAGLDASTAPGTPPNVLVSGMDRNARIRFTCMAVAAWPVLLLLPAMFVWVRRRLRE